MQKSKIKNQIYFLQKFWKIISFSFFTFCFFGVFNFVDALTINSQTPNAGGDTLKSGLVGHWTFDGADLVSNVQDKSGNSNTGYMINMATSSAKVGGVLGQALKFDGTDDYIQTVSTDMKTLDSFSFSLWFKADRTSVGHILWQGYSGGNGWGHEQEMHLSLGGTPDGAGGPANNKLSFFMGSTTGATTNLNIINDFTNTTQWHFVVVTVSNIATSPYATMYVDNVLWGTDTASPSIDRSFWNTSVQIGGRASRFLKGKVDDVRVYNRVLSSSEVKQLYNLGGSKLTSQTVNVGGDTLKSGLVGHWTFDGADVVSNVTDKSGNGNTGYMRNMATSSAKVGGKLGQALKFDGVDDYVRTINLGSASFSAGISASIWVYPKNLSGYKTVFDSSSRQLSLWIGSGYYAIGQAQGMYTPSTSFVTNKWQHIVLTSNGSTGTIYRNGVAIASGLSVSTNFTNFVEVGSNPSGGGSYFDGSLDDFRIYNRALSASEIQKLYNLGGSKLTSQTTNAGGDTLKSGLVGHWTFDGADVVSNVADKSGNGNTGYMINMATSSAKVGGKLGQALKFDGSNDYVSVGNNSAMNQNTLSVGLWIKGAPAQGNYKSILQKYYNGSWASWGFNTGTYGNGDLKFYVYTGSDSIVLFPNTLNNKWNYILATFDGNYVRAYLNGVLVNTTAYSGNVLYNSSALEFGTYGNNFFFNGSLDDVRIYNRALSASEIKQLYNMGR